MSSDVLESPPEHARVAPADESSIDHTLGLVGVGDLQMAISLSSLREVAKCPEKLTPLPATSSAVLGAMELRSTIVPVVDVRVLLGTSTDGERGSIVVVVSDGERMLGLLVDAVRGITRVDEADLQPIDLGLGREFVTHAFQQDGGVSACLVDVFALCNLPDLPTISSVRAVSFVDVEERLRKQRRSVRMTVLRCGNYRLGIDVADVYTTLPGVVERPSVLMSNVCRGVVTFRGKEIPVVDPLQFLGLGSLAGSESGAYVVLEIGTGFVAMSITSLVEITDVDSEAVFEVDAFAVNRPDMVRSVIRDSNEDLCFVLDASALRSEETLSSLAGLNINAEDETKNPDDVASVAKGPSYLSYAAGVDLATPLEQVDEIIPFPSSLVSTGVGGPVLGLIVHRNVAVPVVSVQRALGTNTQVTEGCLLIVTAGERRVAFAIERLHVVSALCWAEPEFRPGNEPLSRCRPIQLVGTDKLYPDLDLQDLVGSVSLDAGLAKIFGS